MQAFFNLGKVIGKEFIINEIDKNRQEVKPNISYRFDWDLEKGKHINAVELFKSSMTPESTPKYEFTVEKAYLYNEKLKFLHEWESKILTKEDSKVLTKDEKKALEEEKRTFEAEVKNLKDYNRTTRPEVDKYILDLTYKALEDGATMTCDDGQRVLKHFMMNETYIKDYFIDMGIVLRPVIDCARTAYLKNDGKYLDQKDIYNTVLLHQRVTDFISNSWKAEITKLLKLIVSIRSINYNSVNDEKSIKLESKEKLLKDLCEIFAVSDEKNILYNDINHALNGKTGRNLHSE